MSCKGCMATFVICFVPTAAFSYVPGEENGRCTAITLSSRPALAANTDGLWTCWQDGAPIHRLPLPTREAVFRAADAGEVFAVEEVEVTPFGIEWLRVGRGERSDPLWIPLAYCHRVAPENTTGGDLPIGSERIEPRGGLPFGYCPSDLMQIPERYCYNDLPQQLRAEAAEALVRMLDAARREAGLTIKVVSAYRSARTQAYLCRRKIESAGIGQCAVARPGHSEHQLGTAVDLVGANGLHLLDEQFGATREGLWLDFNCHRFGFVKSYSRRRALDERTPHEPWHFRYVGRENTHRLGPIGAEASSTHE